ncbi:MAG TPA: hypothetical protein VFT91_08670 [Dehalococcoidia bacterium]|nr:hypothetical protein [Dehalococcoidia bacterium]
MPEEKALTLHPDGKRGVNVSRAKYEAVRAAMIEQLHNGGQLTASQLFSGVQQSLGPAFQGSVAWYAEWVKLDLEARKVIERLSGRPRRYRLMGS